MAYKKENKRHLERFNKNNRHNKAYPAKVNIHGIAETEISLAADQNVLKQIANRYMMKGDSTEGVFHEFYVTASYDGKVLNTNQTNVDIANPDYKKDQPKPKPTTALTRPASTSQPTPSPQKDESLVATSIKFMVDAIVGAFNTPEKTKSPSMVKEQPKPKISNNGKCQSCNISLTVADLDKFMTAAGHGSIINKAPYNTRIPAYINYLNQYMTLFEINKNCYRRANFLGQVAKETKFWSYKEDFIYSATGLLDLKNFKSTEGRSRASEWRYLNNKSEVTKEREIK